MEEEEEGPGLPVDTWHYILCLACAEPFDLFTLASCKRVCRIFYHLIMDDTPYHKLEMALEDDDEPVRDDIDDKLQRLLIPYYNRRFEEQWPSLTFIMSVHLGPMQFQAVMLGEWWRENTKWKCGGERDKPTPNQLCIIVMKPGDNGDKRMWIHVRVVLAMYGRVFIFKALKRGEKLEPPAEMKKMHAHFISF